MDKYRQTTKVLAPLGRRQFLVASGVGVAGLMLFPFDSVCASPVFSAVAKFAQSIGASEVATTINNYVSQDELEKKTVEVTAGGGKVKVIANGAGDIVAIKIDKEVVDPNDVEFLEEIVLTAVKQAATLSDRAQAVARA